jgi:hypothetical protein
MTSNSTTARFQPDLPAQQASGAPDVDGYRPGVCNIGSPEIAKRRRAGHVGTLAAIMLLGVLFAVDAPPLARLLVIIPAVLAASGYLQAHFKFCAGYAAIGAFNFEELGRHQRVTDPDAARRDRARARELGLAAFAIGAAVGLLAFALPI